MQWLTVHIETSHAGLDTVITMLSTLDVDSISIEDETEFQEFLAENRQAWDYVDEALENQMRGRSVITVYLPENEQGFDKLAQIRIALQKLREECNDCGSLLMSLENIQNADWENNWKQYYKPMETGEKLLIVPQWEQVESGNRIPVILDPGLAFGTGSHDTTRMCLEMLETCVHGGEKILDLGCGSGILSIAALRLHAASVTAVDIDEICTRVTVENAALNGFHGDHIQTFTGNILTDSELQKQIQGKYSVILANIVADVILKLIPMIPGLLAENGQFLCSGIIADRVQEIRDCLKKNGFVCMETRESRDWYALRCVIADQN